MDTDPDARFGSTRPLRSFERRVDVTHAQPGLDDRVIAPAPRSDAATAAAAAELAAWNDYRRRIRLLVRG